MKLSFLECAVTPSNIDPVKCFRKYLLRQGRFSFICEKELSKWLLILSDYQIWIMVMKNDRNDIHLETIWWWGRIFKGWRITWGFLGGSDSKASACNVGDLGLIPGSGRSPGEGNGNPLQYSCLESPMDRGAWWATVHRVAKSWAQLSDLTYLLTYLLT